MMNRPRRNQVAPNRLGFGQGGGGGQADSMVEEAEAVTEVKGVAMLASSPGFVL